MTVLEQIKALPGSIQNVCRKAWLGFKEHPWCAVIGLASAIAFLPVCKYCTILIIAAMLVWAVRKFD